MRSIVLLVLLAACSGNKARVETPPTGGSGTEPSHTSCSADTDCVIVETSCCDHCNGGKAEAFNVAFADQHKPTGCEQIACTEMACGPAIAKCEAGRCTSTIGPLE
jgi:hypothetical protein